MAGNLRRTAALVLGLTLTVNALNYLRDAALAARFGASPASDAIFSALLLPAILQQMLVAGTLAPAVVPVYLEMAGHSPAQARRLTWQVLLSVAVGLIPLAVLAVFLTPALVNLLFPGFDAATQALTVQALRPFWPGAVCLILAGLTGSLLNAADHFVLPALTPGLGSALALMVLWLRPAVSVSELALALALAMAMQLLLHLPGLWAAGRNPDALPAPAGGMNPAVRSVRFVPARPLRRVLMLSLPLFAYVSLSQIMTLIERVFASHLGAGAVARLTLAQKLASLPLFLVAGSLAVVIFPRLAALQMNRADFSAALASGLRTALPLLLLATAWLMSGSQLLVALLYQHGLFSSRDGAQTAILLQGYALGLAPAGLGAILLKALHARQDVRSPLWVAAVSLLCYLALAALCSRAWGALGLALALSTTALISTSLLALILVRRHQALAWRRLLHDLRLLLPAAAAALAAGWLGEAWLQPALGDGLPALLLRLLVLILVGGGAFAVLARGAGFVRGDPRSWLEPLRPARAPPVSQVEV